jgi:uracil-DNA glycosylase
MAPGSRRSSRVGGAQVVSAGTTRALNAHRARLAACRLCSHGDPRIQPVLSGAVSPKAMLVGQAPGRVEVEIRRPFAGRAGRTMFRWLERTGVSEDSFREHVYIAAITRCFPGPSPTGRGDRVPSPRERRLCADWLDAELKLLRPPLVIPVGRLAIDRFLGPVPLSDVVGKARKVEVAPGVTSTIVALPHPSGASSWIHAPENSKLLDRALRLLRREFATLGISDSPAATTRIVA